MPLDFYKNTREECTNVLLEMPVPDDAHEWWKETVLTLKDLYSRLAFHDAMKPNIHQTYMTPANSKNNVYFMWDFVGRSLAIASNVDPSLPEDMPAQEREFWIDAYGRSYYASQLILDDKPGMLDSMTEALYPDQKGKHPDFGEEIRAICRGIVTPPDSEDKSKTKE